MVAWTRRPHGAQDGMLPYSRRACQPFLMGKAPQRPALSCDKPKSGAPTLKRFCPAGANSVEYAHRQHILAPRGKDASFPPPFPSALEAGARATPASMPPVSRAPKTAIYSHHRPIRTETQHTRPLLVGQTGVNFEPTALSAGTAGPAGSARTRPRDTSLGNPFWGNGNHFPPSAPVPQNAAGGKPLRVGLPPSVRTFAPFGTKRSAQAPYSWGLGA